MWKVTGFEPNSVNDTNIATVYADEAGRLLRVDFKTKFGGKSTTVTYPDGRGYGERLNSVVREPQNDGVKIGDLLLSREGIICEILDIKRTSSIVDKFVFIAYTAFGCCCLPNKGLGFVAHDKIAYSSLATVRTNGFAKFTRTRREYIISYVKNNFDPFTTYEEHSGRKVDSFNMKVYARRKLKEVLSSPEASQFLMNTVLETIQSNGITPEKWIQKVIDSVPDQIKTTVQKDLWDMVGKMIPDVRSQLLIAEGEDPNEGGKSYGVPGAESAQEANYKDVCRVCGDKGTYEATAPDGLSRIEVVCPLCQSKALPAPQAREEEVRLKL